MELSNVEQVLGLKEKIRSQLDLVKLGGKGVSKGTVIKLAKHLSIGLKGIATLLSVNQRTIQRLSAGKVFSRTVSERILRIALVAARGEEVFGDRERFNIWLKEPNQAMLDQTPLSLLASDFGTDLVLEELGRIEHGIIS
ncbi:MAG: antitoxin Xre/MbcA/ParS toxin-binding domain-containing protein [Thermodesulfobacteriota bacterium]|jgi:putative toxin-antitoxin system antitoxin component (TIGR02293 family)